MTRIGLLSDTHAFWDDKYLNTLRIVMNMARRRHRLGGVARKLVRFPPLPGCIWKY